MAQEHQPERHIASYFIAQFAVAVAVAYVAGGVLSSGQLSQKAAVVVWYSSLLAQSVLLGYWATANRERRFLRWGRSGGALAALAYVAVMFSDLGGLDGRYQQRRAEYVIFVIMLLGTGYTLALLVGVFQQYGFRSRPYPRSEKADQFQLWELFVFVSICSALLAAVSVSLRDEGQWLIHPRRLVEYLFDACVLATIALAMFRLTLAACCARVKVLRAAALVVLLAAVALGIALPTSLRWGPGPPMKIALITGLFWGTQLLSYMPLAIWHARRLRAGNPSRTPEMKTDTAESDSVGDIRQ